jgi:hypothetical protein
MHIVRRDLLDGLVLQARLVDQPWIEVAQQDVLGQPVGQNLDQLIVREAAGTDRDYADTLTIREMPESVRWWRLEQRGQALARRSVEQLLDERLDL